MRRWFVWVDDAWGWRCLGSFPEGAAEGLVRAHRFAYAYAFEAV